MKHVIKQAKQILGILDAVVTHVVDKTEATIKWEGPKISPEQWCEMLAFFKWTYKSNRSESQVRLFVNKDQWAIWAFPQKANTGMTALELDIPEATEQRELFKESEGWNYFGTVHHHCGMTAFQSGTDKENEDKIDGLHITIGKMDEKQHDMHARLLIGKQQFEVDMSWFWDIGDVALLIPSDLHNRIARHQMTIPASEAAEFPKQWKDNYTEVKPVTVTSGFSHGEYQLAGAESTKGNGCPHMEWKVKRIETAIRSFELALCTRDIDPVQNPWFQMVLEYEAMDHSLMDLVHAISEEDITWDDLLKYAEYMEDKEWEREEKEEEEEVKDDLDAEIEAEREQMQALQGLGLGPAAEKARMEAQQAAADAQKDTDEWDRMNGGYIT